MCHEYWWRRRAEEERAASRRMWDEFERTRPLSDPHLDDDEAEVTLEEQDPAPLGTQR